MVSQSTRTSAGVIIPSFLRHKESNQFLQEVRLNSVVDPDESPSSESGLKIVWEIVVRKFSNIVRLTPVRGSEAETKNLVEFRSKFLGLIIVEKLREDRALEVGGVFERIGSGVRPLQNKLDDTPSILRLRKSLS